MKLNRFCYEYANYVKKINKEYELRVDKIIKMAENGLIPISELMNELNRFDYYDHVSQ